MRVLKVSIIYALSLILLTSFWGLDHLSAQSAEELEIQRDKDKQKEDLTQAPKEESRVEFHGMLYMMGWIGLNTNYAFIYDNDSYIGFKYKFSKRSQLVIDLKIADVLKPSNEWADTEIYGEVDLLELAEIQNYGLLLKLGKVKKKHEYFGEYAMGIGKDFIADKRVNRDMLNWHMVFLSYDFPIEVSFMSDLDFGHQPAISERDFSDWNDKGLSLMSEVKLRDLKLTDTIKYSASLFYDELFFINEKSGNFIASNSDTLDPNNKTRYIGGTTRLLFDMGNVSLSLGAAAKYFSEKKHGTITSQDDTGNTIEKESTSKKEAIDYEVGFWFGNFTTMDFRVAYQQVEEFQANSQKTVGVEANIYNIPNATMYMGVAFALEDDIINFGVSNTTTRSYYGWDIGVIYKPVFGVLITVGWQKMVRWDDYGYFYIKATYWW